MRYLLQRGRGSQRRVNHLCGHDPRTGKPTMLPVCGDTRLVYDTTLNMPLGRPTCKRCQAALIDGSGGGE